jgi:IPT/TIG domain
MLRSLRSLSLVLAVASLLAPAVANAASKKKPVYPTISSISPRKLSISEKLTIKGTHLSSGKAKSSVAFYRPGKPVVFVKADSSTSTKVVVTLPTKLAGLLAQREGLGVPTQLRLRVVATKMSKSWTKNSRSPVVIPLPGAEAAPGTEAAAQQAAALAYKNCQEQAVAAPAADADADGLANGTELQYSLDPCVADTDGDSLSDGYEFWSAVDLNGAAVPYPGKRPWPNPLDPTDINYDFDGDGLHLWQEYKLWKASNTGFPLTQYSDGTQNTGGTQPVTTAAQRYLDIDGDGNLTDEERDFDGDGLSNMVEFNYTGTQHWWKTFNWHYKPHGPSSTGLADYIEPPYELRAFSDLDPTDPDTDGDTIPDGADDQDNDGWSNFVEMQLSRGRSGYRVQPFNPCLPDPHARTCSRWLPTEGTKFPPFDVVDPSTGATSGMKDDAIPFAWYEPVNYTAWVADGSRPPYDSSLPHPMYYNPFVEAGPWDMTPWFTEAWDGFSGPQGS